MDKRVIIFFFLVNIIHVWSSPHLAQLMKKRDVFCGKKLTDAVALVCGGIYNGPNKKSLSDYMAFSNEYGQIFPENDDDGQLDFPFLQKETANSFLPMRMLKRGISDECCAKPCSLHHLSLYCA
ncbi:Insulin domain containing protein [Asbolus verrucosus]|uniref:Insulin domain containing protein n=1 Tax=Asbolus verrucosus TaxID=1661398 RepID=A0A482V9T0_ASBVE|nr:Insulin domain containing protein [Asbolus verrucosus]